jgi:hypothetical protein
MAGEERGLWPQANHGLVSFTFGFFLRLKFKQHGGGDLGTAPMAIIYGEMPMVEASFSTKCTDSTFALSRTNASRGHCLRSVLLRR